MYTHIWHICMIYVIYVYSHKHILIYAYGSTSQGLVHCISVAECSTVWWAVQCSAVFGAVQCTAWCSDWFI